jgi:hypothetical protein
MVGVPHVQTASAAAKSEYDRRCFNFITPGLV